MKLTDYAMDSNGSWMDVYFNDVKQDGTKILIVGANSDQYTGYEKKLQKAFLKSKGNNIKPEELEKFNIDKYCSCVLDWEGLEDDNGKELKCSYENKHAIFSDRKKYKWLIDQVEAFINDDSNFLSLKSMEN